MISEKRIEGMVIRFFENLGFMCVSQVRILERCVDVVGGKDGEIVSIELKVRDWKRAVKQALICRLWSHYVYIGFWHRFLPKDLSIFSELGIGLLTVNSRNVEKILEPNISEIIHLGL